jgi:hypothetical protein
VDPNAGLDDVEKRKFLTLLRLELLPLGRPTCGQSLYRLHYPGSYRDDFTYVSVTAAVIVRSAIFWVLW